VSVSCQVQLVAGAVITGHPGRVGDADLPYRNPVAVGIQCLTQLAQDLMHRRVVDVPEAPTHVRIEVSTPPYNLTDRQAVKLATIQQTNARLYRAYLLKEQLRQIFPTSRCGHRAPARSLAGLGPGGAACRRS
jgi:hypothetical protein